MKTSNMQKKYFGVSGDAAIVFSVDERDAESN